MTFSAPWVLLLLALPLALGVWEVRRHGLRVRVPVDHVAARRARVWPRVLMMANLMPAVVAGAAVVILAGPKRLGPPGQERELTNIEICLDVSGSMSSPMATAPDGASRSKTAMAAIDYFTQKRAGDAMGLTIFGVDVVRWCPLTKDTSAIRNATPFLDPETLPPSLGGTRIGNALRYCRDVLTQQPEGDRLVILLTDGFSGDLSGGAAGQIGGELAADDVVVYAVNISDEPPHPELTAVVAPTGGDVFSAQNLASLTGVFDHIDRMHKVKIKPTQRESIDFFGPFCWVGLAGLCGFVVSMLGVRYTPW